jgi:carotenoid cleavage dioxygenase-like enzyme
MTTPFPNTPDFAGFNAPSRVEADIFDLVVLEGAIPAEISGRWYRSIPDPQYPPMLGDDTYLSGDGMVSMFTFEAGHVDYKCRYVQTPRLMRERAARRGLHGLYRNPFTDDPLTRGLDGRSVSNTTPVFHAGRLLATKEDGPPTLIDPHSLATHGIYDFGGKLRSKTMTAHPRIDFDTGEMFFFGYQVDTIGSRTMSLCVADRDGALIREEWFEAPYASLVHDFLVTKDYIIYPLMPCIADFERIAAGGPHWRWEAGRGSYVGIMPRNGSVKEMRWFKGPDASFFHFLNAFNDGPVIQVDASVSEEMPFMFIRAASGQFTPPDMSGPGNGVFRWTFDMSKEGESWDSRPLGPPGDLPIIAKTSHMKDYDVAYYGSYMPQYGAPILAGAAGIGFNCLFRLNVKTGEVKAASIGPRHTIQEPMHIPSRTPGHEGWLVFIVDYHDMMLSRLHIIEAANPDKGSIAVVDIPLRLRNGVHGWWVQEEDMPAQG